MTNLADATQATMALVERHAAHNYSPLPVVAASAEGAWIADIDGLRYLDWLAAYSAVNLGHRNPASTATAHAQVDTVTLLNRALHADRLGPLGAALAQLCGKDVVLPMNSDAEAVESGLRVARKWGADVNGLPRGPARYHFGKQQLSWPHQQCRQLLVGPGCGQRRRTFYPGTPLGTVWRCCGTGADNRRQHRR